MPTEFTTPVGRIVWGNPARSSLKKDQSTKQPIMREGKQVEQWAFGVAFEKADFEQLVMPYLQQEVHTLFPQGVPANFSWKFKDGDTVDRQGKPYSDREGHGGCYILTVSTEAFAPPIYKNEGGTYRQIDSAEIKTGDYVVVSINAKVNKPLDASHTPGIYMNPRGIELVGYGQEIVGMSANPEEMFGGKTHQLPQGASAIPVASVSNAAPPYAAPTAAPLPTPPYAAPTAAPLPTPAQDFVQNAGQHQQVPVQYAAPMPGTPQPR